MTTAASFFDDWSIYQEILAHNSMHHDDLYARVRDQLAVRFANRPFSILDLGCGSAQHLARALAGRQVRRYAGYDLAQGALDQAAVNLASLDGQVELHCADLLAGLRQPEYDFDLVFASFALHHLSSEGKAEFFRLAAERLAPGGTLMVVDTFRDDGESRAEYLDRYCAWLGARCVTLPPAAIDRLCAHIRTCDFPETPALLRAMSTGLGFTAPEEVSRFRWHRVWAWQFATK